MLVAIEFTILAFTALVVFLIVSLNRKNTIIRLREMGIRDSIIAAQNNEQNRIAEDLHDELAPVLSAIRLQLGNIRPADDATKSTIEVCSSQLKRSIENIRLISRCLSDRMVISNGLVASIQDSLSLFERHASVNIEQNIHVDEMLMSGRIKNNIYKILMELVNNTVRHSNANRIKIEILSDTERVTLTYSDNGNDHTGVKQKAGLGTMNIVNRLEIINGRINNYNTDFSNGAFYQIMIPLPAHEK